jgi:MFS family permease
MPHAADAPEPSSAAGPPDADPATQGDTRTIALVGLAHGTSHFHHLLLPPLFPWLMPAFGLNYAQLGLLMTVFFVISGIGQALAGFLVDRVGARPVLFGALGCFAAAGLAASVAQGYGGLMAATALAGLGNAPFHPVDFTILNKRVRPQRLGHAFSVHGLSGNLGWAAAPLFLTGLAAWSGQWRLACLGAAVLASAVLVLMVSQRRWLDDRWAERALGSRAAGAPGVAAGAPSSMAFLRLPSVWLCFGFFFWSTLALAAVQNFAGPALHLLHGLPLATAGLVVSGYMVAGAIGMVAGGFLVARVERLERTIGAALMLSAVLLMLAGAPWLPPYGALAVAAVAGVGTGLAGPSRDMLIRRATPPGATGRVYGTVYSGLDLGFAIGAPVFGRVLDAGHAAWVFDGAALALLAGVASAAWVALHVAAQSRRAALAAVH